MGPTTTLLLVALWVSGRAALRAGVIATLSDESNLNKCRSDVDYCSAPKSSAGTDLPRRPLHVLAGCTDEAEGTCRYRCPLGQPLVQAGFNKGGRRCAAKCPPGYYMGDYRNREACVRHTRTCPEGQRMIVQSTTWHDTICGYPEDYVTPTGLWDKLEPGVLQEKLNDLTLIWIRDLPEEVAIQLCEHLLGEEPKEECKYHLESFLFDFPTAVERVYCALNEISAFQAATSMYRSVVRPFRKLTDGEPMVSILFEQTNPWWVADGGTITIRTKLSIPEGMSERYVLKELLWARGARGSPASRTVLLANNTSVSPVDSRYNIVRGLEWNKSHTRGFFVQMFDISLVVENFYCGLLETTYVNVLAYDRYAKRRTQFSKSLQIKCIWKPRLHPTCNCTRALLEYNNPDGLCSPTCITSPFTHLSKGVEGSGDDWTLQITHEKPETSGGGRVLYGSVVPKTERFCLVTTDIFALSPGPARDAPSAPLDVMRCDVVLVEIHVWLEDLPPGTAEQRYLTVAVRSLSHEGDAKTPGLYIPVAARDTLDTVVRQGWGGKIGIKFSFSHSSRAAPRQEELAAVLDWISTARHVATAVRVVVIDVDIETVKTSNFVMLSNLYGSKLELIPGLSANTLADAMRARRYTEYNHFKCRSSNERCARLANAYDRSDKVLYRRAVESSIPECQEIPVSSQRCVACWDRGAEFANLVLTCPSSFELVRMEDDKRALLIHGPHDPPLQWHNCTQFCPLSPEQQRAETVLQELGLLVSSHGAFLNLDTVSVFPPEIDVNCGQMQPARWSVGEYTAEDPYTIRLPRNENYPERTGLLVFEELCRRSNNRGGIVVSVPSADYIPGPGCETVRLLNRHVKMGPVGSTDDDGDDNNRVRYSMHSLAGIIGDMAKWGVCRYSLGYLDYTFGNSEGVPTFVELSRLINTAATRIRTLHYRYTRNFAFGDGTHSYARVDGVYKLEGGMFFQRVTEETVLTKSFAQVPDVPNLRLGLSSDMNVGAPLPPISELIIQDAIETVESVPPGAHVVSLNYKGMVAFVNRNTGRICAHSPSTAVERSDGPLRLPSFGVQSITQEGESRRPPCRSYISGARHRARVSVPVPITSESRGFVLRSLSDVSRWLGAPMLTGEERDWLSSSEAVERDNRTSPPSPLQGAWKGLASTPDSMHLISKTIECVRGSSSCVDLGDYANNRWPEGGTGYPIAISSISKSSDEILVKMILCVNHGAVRVNIPCDWKPFSFESEQRSFLHPTQGYYTHTEEPQISKVRRYVATAGPLATGIVRPVAQLFCPDADRSLADHLPSSETYFQKTCDCVSVANETLWDLQEVFSRLGSLSGENGQTKRVAPVTHSRVSALCLTAMVLTILINATLFSTLCCLCKGGLYHRRHVRKIQ